MSLLTIIQAVADEMNLMRPTQVFGNDDPEIQKALSFANRVGGDLLARGTWQATRLPLTFTGVAGMEQAALPADFSRIVPETFWELGARRFVAGPTAPVVWDGLAAGQCGGWQLYWTRRNGKLLVLPAPSGGEHFGLEYFSNAFCESAGGARQSQWLADSDEPILPAELFILGVVARMAASEGDVTANLAIASYEKRVAQELKNDKPTARVMTSDPLFGGRRHPGGAPAPDGQFYWPGNSWP